VHIRIGPLHVLGNYALATARPDDGLAALHEFLLLEMTGQQALPLCRAHFRKGNGQVAPAPAVPAREMGLAFWPRTNSTWPTSQGLSGSWKKKFQIS